jgi:uncharacterized protein (DUF1697 family)
LDDRRVALFRGINVGRAKRIAMADLRELFEGLGYGGVRSLLVSGNLVFTAPADEAPAESAARIGEALEARAGFSARVTVLTAEQLATAVEGNPLADTATEPSRLQVAFLADPADRKRLEPLLDEDWQPEALALGDGVAYLWCPAGILKGDLWEAVDRALGDAVTTRNWSTVKKLQALLEPQDWPCVHRRDPGRRR